MTGPPYSGVGSIAKKIVRFNNNYVKIHLHELYSCFFATSCMDVDPSQRNEYLNKAVIYLRNSALLKGLSPIICSVAPSRSERRRFLNVEEGVLNKLKEEGLDLKRYLVLVDVSDDIVLKNAYLRKADTETVEKELKDFKKKLGTCWRRSGRV